MRISTKDWKAYINRLTALNERAAEEMRQYVRRNGFADTRGLIDWAYGLVTKYGEGSAALSAEMYDAIAEMERAAVPPAVPAETADYRTVAKAVQGVTRQTQNEEILGSAVGRLVKQAGADTTLQNALRDGAEFAWIPSGDTCAFCIALASRGWQTASKKAIKNGHAEHIHNNCDCTYAIRFNEATQVQGYDPDHYLMMYETAGGISPEDKINALRREFYAENKERINAQKRAAYRSRADRAGLISAKFQDVSSNWYASATPNSHAVRDLRTYVAPDGTAYPVHGREVVFDYKPHEKEIAELLERELGGEIYMVPRVNSPQGVSTPDFLFRGRPYDLKTISENAGKNTIFNRIKKASRQADNFVIDVSASGLSDQAIDQQLRKIYWSQNTQFVDEIIVVRDGGILRIVKRKK